ncbi:PLDc N-terminal domain-containing protein [Pustulibacterium marinum]|uniref:PLDc N-terminal domain-containing protein n=1 Tax=Pustulibacterium marinum TaxID=1224947 RepID=UPI00373FCB7E
MLVYILLAITITVLAVRNILKTEFKQLFMKIFCIISVIIFPVIGALVYFQFKRRLAGSKRRTFQLKTYRASNFSSSL